MPSVTAIEINPAVQPFPMREYNRLRMLETHAGARGESGPSSVQEAVVGAVRRR